MTPEDRALLKKWRIHMGWNAKNESLLASDFRGALALIDRLLQQQEALTKERDGLLRDWRAQDEALQRIYELTGMDDIVSCPNDVADYVEAQQEAQAREKERRACDCRQPDPVMQADDKFYCHTCSFETGARPSMLPEVEVLAIIKAKVAAEARLAVLEGARQWQPIETAPKDTAVLVWDSYKSGMGVAMWRTWPGYTGGLCWSGPAECDEYPANGPITPTHWMPLPEAPRAAPAVDPQGVSNTGKPTTRAASSAFSPRGGPPAQD